MINWEEVRNTVYFPLCYSDKQRQSMDMLFFNNNIIIDGNCGTGKSQTVVNLICNLMAHGKSVVVTSKNESQLITLFNRVPEPIRTYCELRFNDNFKKINKKNSLTKSTAREFYRNICELKNELNCCKIRQKEIKNKLEKIKDMRKAKIQYEGEKYSIDYVEYWIKKNEHNYSWFIDDIDLIDKCPITDYEFEKLIYTLNKIDRNHFQILKLKGNIIDIISNYDDIYIKIQEIRKGNENKESKALIQNVKNLLYVSELYSASSALEDYLMQPCSKNLEHFMSEYNIVEIFKKERIYYKKSMEYINILKNSCPLLVVNILDSENYDVFKGRKINEAWKWKQLSKLIKIASKINCDYYEKELNLQKNKEMNICKEIITKQLQYNEYIDYKVNKKEISVPVIMVPLNKLKTKNSKDMIDRDVIVIEDGEDIGTSSLDVFNKFDKTVITENSKLYEKDVQNQIINKINASKIKLNYEYRTNPRLYSSIAIKVNKGMKEKNINIAEANEIVKYITMCVQDKNYDNMSFGVISLYNNDQAAVIEDKLLKKLGKKVIKDRNLICGDINSFVGDERDIIFISMVVANNTRFYSAKKKFDKIKYVIAATRAKSEMWVFYSFDKYIINKQCMRYKLLKNCEY